MITIFLNVMLGISAFLALIGVAGAITHERRRTDKKVEADLTKIDQPSRPVRQFDWSLPPDAAADSTLDIDTSTQLSAWFAANTQVKAEFAEALQANTQLQQERRRAVEAMHELSLAEERVGSLEDSLELNGLWHIRFTFGAFIVAALLLADVLPLNWMAQAFGLGVAATWIVTAIWLAASGGAMAGLELTRYYRRRHTALLALIAAAYVALVSLRTSFLVTIVRTPVTAAALQALLLGAISASLLICGATVIARTQPLRLARAVADARRARRRAASQDAWLRAEESVQRHWAALQRLLREWSITSTIPANVSQADRINALEHALRTLIPQG